MAHSIIAVSKTEEQHLMHPDMIIRALQRHGTKFYAELSKCSLAQSELLFLGPVVGKDGVLVSIHSNKLWVKAASCVSCLEYLLLWCKCLYIRFPQLRQLAALTHCSRLCMLTSTHFSMFQPTA